MKKKNQELASAELQRLRSTAKIEYLNKDMVPDAKSVPGLPGGAAAAGAVAGAEQPAGAAAEGAAPAAAPAAATAPAENTNSTDKAAIDRGVAGLK